MQSKILFQQQKAVVIYANFVRTHVKISPWRQKRGKRECYLDNTEKPYTDRHNMAEFMFEHRTRKPWMKVIPKDKDSRYNDYVWHDSFVSDPAEAKETAESKLKRFEQSLKDRGHARERVPYQPAENVQEIIIKLYKSSLLESGSSEVPATDQDMLALDLNSNKELKFKLITKCIENFDHDLPTSYLNDVNNIEELIEYFNTPVRGINPYAAMLRRDESLPTNLSLISEPDRWDVESDTFFKGYSALPGIISKVPGLRGKKKFPILNQSEFQWPDI